MKNKIRIAVLLSGNGSTYQYIQDQIEAEKLNAETVIVVSSRGDAYGLERARKFGIPTAAVSRKEFKAYGSGELTEFNNKLIEVIKPYKPDLVVLAGFMSLLTTDFIKAFDGMIINTHPALIPAFCGENLYGNHVHKAAADYGVKITGCTIHFVDEKYDHGPIILQKTVPVEFEDTFEDISRKVQEIEKPLYCEAIKLFSEGRIEILNRKVRISN